MAQKQIFRQVALERMSSPEQLDLLMQITNPRSWLALIALGSLLVVAVVLAFVGRIPIEAPASAILLRTGGIKNIVSIAEGQITTMYVQQGDIVEEGQPIAEVASLTQPDEAVTVVSLYNGRILEMKAGVGDLVSLGAPLAGLEFVGDDTRLQAVLYMALADGEQVEPGMDVQIAPITVESEEYGYVQGRVTAVDDFPVTYSGMLQTLGSDELVQSLALEGVALEVWVELIPDPTTPSGFQWSSSSGPGFELSSGTLATAKVVVDRQWPIELILPLN